MHTSERVIPPSHRPARVGFALVHGLAVGGGAALIASIFLKWEDLSSGGQHHTAKAQDVSVQFLVDYTTKFREPSLVLVLAISAALIIGGVLIPRQVPGGRVLALLGAALAIATTVMYGFQVHQLLRALHVGRQIGVTDFVGIAPYVAFGGGMLAVFAALLSIPMAAAE